MKHPFRSTKFLILLTVAVANGADFQVTLANCSEFIGIASVPISRVQPLVPATYHIAEGPPGLASLVVRASLCRNGGSPIRVAQLGVVIISPDGSGDINNYALSYSTDDSVLAFKLATTGWPVALDPDLVYEVTPDPPGAGGTLFADQSPPLGPAGWFLSGIVTDPPPTPNFPFTANWWFKLHQGQIKMSTSIPLLNYGSGSVTVYTRRQSLLGGLIGGNTSTFGTNLRGVFADGTLSVKKLQ